MSPYYPRSYCGCSARCLSYKMLSEIQQRLRGELHSYFSHSSKLLQNFRIQSLYAISSFAFTIIPGLHQWYLYTSPSIHGGNFHACTSPITSASDTCNKIMANLPKYFLTHALADWLPETFCGKWAMLLVAMCFSHPLGATFSVIHFAMEARTRTGRTNFLARLLRAVNRKSYIGSSLKSCVGMAWLELSVGYSCAGFWNLVSCENVIEDNIWWE